MLQALLHPLILQGWLTAPLFMLAGLIILIVIGVIIIKIAGVFIFLLPAFILAGVVWWLTGSQLMAGGAFLFVALLSLTRRRR
jgi:hypothetical protein